MRHRLLALALALVPAIAPIGTVAGAEVVLYTFSFAGAEGSLAGDAFSGQTVSWTLVADTNDVQPGSPRGFNVTPTSGSVIVGDQTSAITTALIADSAVWTYTNDEVGLRIGFGIYDPFESFTSGSYEGPLGWAMTTAFAGSAVGDESILRAIEDDGIQTEAGTLLLSGYVSTSFEAVVVPAPAAAIVLLGGLARSARRRRPRSAGM